MSKFKELIETISPTMIQTGPMIEIINVIDEHLDKICFSDPNAYHSVMNDIYMIANGPYFNLDVAMKAVAGMKNEDGTIGEKISLENSYTVASQLGITFDKFTKYDWYYVLNMMYSDYVNVIGSNSQVYNEMAKAFIMDSDSPKGKAYLYYCAMSDK
jgi:hypothetical protein